MQNLLGAIPFLTTFLWSSVFYFRQSAETRSWRWSLAMGCIFLGSFSLVITETLSATHQLLFFPTLISWTTVSLAPLILLWQCRHSIILSTEIARIRNKILLLPIWNTCIIAGVFCLVFTMALVTPPMNFDVQMYHLPREFFWMMLGSVKHFETSYPFQNSHPILTEFIGLNLLIISKSDIWNNLVQFWFCLTSCGLISLLVRSLSGSPRAQGIAALFVILTPVVFFESSNAKNDVVLSTFILIPLFIAISLWRQKISKITALLVISALSAGLAFATKGTAIAYLPSIAALTIIATIKYRNQDALFRAIIPVALLVIAPSLPNSIRNLEQFHSLNGPSNLMVNDSFDVRSITSIAVKNLVNQYAFGSEKVIASLEKATRKTLDILGLESDGKTNFSSMKLHFLYFEGLEDVIPAPVQTSIILLSPIVLFFRRFRNPSIRVIYILSFFFSILFFCSLFKWQPWNGRLLIPAYFIAAPIAGLILDFIKPSFIPFIFTVAELFFLKPHLIYNGQRPLFGGSSVFKLSKDEQMSRMMPGRYNEICDIIALIRQRINVSTICIDGKQTEVYGILRMIHSHYPKIKLISGTKDTMDSGYDLCIISSIDYPGQRTPSDFSNTITNNHLIYSGKYYHLLSREN